MSVISDLGGWFADLLSALAEVDARLLVLACLLQAGQTILNGVAWRNILSSAYPDEHVPHLRIIAAYAGGIGLNSVVPAQGGTVAYMGLFRTLIRGSTVPGIVVAAAVQGIFFGLTAAAMYVYLFSTRPGSFDIHLGWLGNRPLLAFIVAAAVVALVAVVVVVLRRRLRRTWAAAREGAAILRTPRAFLFRVLAPQGLAYIARLGVAGTLMTAYNVDVSLRNVLLVIAAGSISSTFAVTPGGVGTTQALAAVALRDVAATSVITAYSFGQQFVVTAFNMAFGLLALGLFFGRSATVQILRRTRAGDDPGAPEEAGALAASQQREAVSQPPRPEPGPKD